MGSQHARRLWFVHLSRQRTALRLLGLCVFVLFSGLHVLLSYAATRVPASYTVSSERPYTLEPNIRKP